MAEPGCCYYADDPRQRPHCQLTAVVRYAGVALSASCDRQRSTLGKGHAPVPLRPGRCIDPLDWVASAHAATRKADQRLAAAVTRARSHGYTRAEIAARLGVTRQAAQQRFKHDPFREA
jgi:hypothetical protein